MHACMYVVCVAVKFRGCVEGGKVPQDGQNPMVDQRMGTPSEAQAQQVSSLKGQVPAKTSERRRGDMEECWACLMCQRKRTQTDDLLATASAENQSQVDKMLMEA